MAYCLPENRLRKAGRDGNKSGGEGEVGKADASRSQLTGSSQTSGDRDLYCRRSLSSTFESLKSESIQANQVLFVFAMCFGNAGRDRILEFVKRGVVTNRANASKSVKYPFHRFENQTCLFRGHCGREKI